MESIVEGVTRAMRGTVADVLGVIAERTDALADDAAAAVTPDTSALADAYLRGREDAFRDVARTVRAIVAGIPT